MDSKNLQNGMADYFWSEIRIKTLVSRKTKKAGNTQPKLYPWRGIQEKVSPVEQKMYTIQESRGC